MIDLLYCFDENYNVQAFLSIKSFIQHNDTQININIIHKNPDTFLEYSEEIVGIKNVNLEIKKFENKNNLPLLINDAHYSEATYYRIFLEDYLGSELENVLYLDPDIICLNDIQNEFKTLCKKLNDKDLVLAAKTDGVEKDAPELFRKLNMKKKYFNAGVMFINLRKWRSINLTKKLENKIIELGENISLADQDALNSFFDGDYLELEEKLNYYADHKADSQLLNYIKKNVFFLHYVGSTKPWTPYGGIDKISNFYHQQHLDIYGKYHIVLVHRKNDAIVLLKKIFNLNIFQIEKPVLYIINFFKVLTKNNKSNIR